MLELNNTGMVGIKSKFVIINCVFLSIFFQAAYGQPESKHELAFEGGAGISFIRGLENIEKYHEPALCFTAGISYQYSFSENFSFFSALDYERKGSVVSLQLSGLYVGPEDLKAHTNYNYMVLPLLARYSFGKHLKMFVNAGPYVAYLIKVTSVTEETDFVPHTELDLTDESYRYDLGISAGLGLRIPVNEKMAFTVEVRNNLGLVNTLKEAPTVEEGGAV